MQEGIVRKGLVVGIICLFLGMNFGSSISKIISESDDKNNISNALKNNQISIITQQEKTQNVYPDKVIEMDNRSNKTNLNESLKIIFIKDESRNSLVVTLANSDLDWSNVGFWNGSDWIRVPNHLNGIIKAGDIICNNYGNVILKWIPTDIILGNWTFPNQTIIPTINQENIDNNRIEPEWSYTDGGNTISTSVSSDGVYIACKTSYNIHFFNKDSNVPLWSVNTGNNMGWVSVSADGSYVAASVWNQLRFYNGVGTLLWSYSIDGFINCLSMSSDGEYIVIGGYDSHMVYLFHKDSSTPVWTYLTTGEVWGVDISSNGNFIVSGGYYDHNLYLFQKDSSTPQWYYTSDAYFYEAVTVSPDGNYICAGDTNGVIYLFEKYSNIPEWTYETSCDFIDGIDMSYNGNYIAVASNANIYFFQKDSSTPQWICSGATMDELRISYTGWFFTGGGNNKIYYFSKDSNVPLWSYQIGYSYSASICLSGEYIAGCGSTYLYFFHYELPNSNPVADFTWIPLYPNPNDPIEFDASTSIDPDGTIIEYRWDFNMDGTTDATGQTATYSWNDYGIYSVALLVIDDSGFIDYIIKKVVIGYEVDDFRYIWIFPSVEKLYMHQSYNIDLIVINSRDTARDFIFGLNRDNGVSYSPYEETFFPPWDLNEGYNCYLNGQEYVFGQNNTVSFSPDEQKKFTFIISNYWNWIKPFSWMDVVGNFIGIAIGPWATDISFLQDICYALDSVPHINYQYFGTGNTTSNGEFNVWVPHEKIKALFDSLGVSLWSAMFTTLGWGMLLFVELSIVVAVLVLICMAVEAYAMASSDFLYQQAYDPDQNYTEIVQPNQPYIPIIENISLEQSTYLSLGANLPVMTDAATRSYAKYLGALEKNSLEWAALQLSVTKYYLQKQINISHEMYSLFDDFFSEVEIPPLTPENISSIRENISQQGLLDIETDILQHYGFNESEMNTIVEGLILANDSFYYEAVDNLSYWLKNFSDVLNITLQTYPQTPNGEFETILDVQPNIIYLNDPPQTIICYIEFKNITNLTGYHINSSLLNNQIQPTFVSETPSDYDNDSVDDFLIEFDGYEVCMLFNEIGEKMLSMSGNVSFNITSIICGVPMNITKTIFYSGSELITTKMDIIPPEIIDYTPNIGFTGDHFTFNITAIDNTEVTTVWVEYWYGMGSHINVEMNYISGNYWEKTITIENMLDTLYYIITANDPFNNINTTGVKSVAIYDNDEPEMYNIIVNPDEQLPDRYVNISAIVIDNIKVNDVCLSIRYPDSTIENSSIFDNKTGNTYYCKKIYSQLGEYLFRIWANDTSSNAVLSSEYSFKIRLNNPPYLPSKPNPENGAIDVDLDIIISWIGGDPDNDTITYDVYFGSTSSPLIVASNLTLNFFDVGALQSNKTYYWKIVAWDKFGFSTPGEIWTFTTGLYLNLLLLIGLINNKIETGNYIGFKARFLFIFDIDNTLPAFLKSGEQFMISKQNQLGYFGEQFIIGIFEGASISALSLPMNHPFRNRLKQLIVTQS